ncbi:MAG: acyl-CoA carboxylase epsilon subunit [Pseudoclavibacter sp.]|nr:acyl-CoA carboxylase epsilon subunit [Pseudoclavibacter sp.]
MQEENGDGAVRIVRGAASEEEIAAVAAVLAALHEEGMRVDRPRDTPSPRTAWIRAQRPMRGGGSASDPFGGGYGR